MFPFLNDFSILDAIFIAACFIFYKIVVKDFLKALDRILSAKYVSSLFRASDFMKKPTEGKKENND
jgi:hypothetical protein